MAKAKMRLSDQNESGIPLDSMLDERIIEMQIAESPRVVPVIVAAARVSVTGAVLKQRAHSEVGAIDCTGSGGSSVLNS